MVDQPFNQLNGGSCPPVNTGVGISLAPAPALVGGSTTPTQDFDKTILCDPGNGSRVILITSYTPTGVPTNVAYNLDGTPYAGVIASLVACGGGGEESDPVQMCDSGVTSFLRWVVKLNGSPTGVVFDTSLSGTPYVPVGPVTMGSCSANDVGNNLHSIALTLDTASNAAGLVAAMDGRTYTGMTIYNYSDTEMARVQVTLANSTAIDPEYVLVGPRASASASFRDNAISGALVQMVEPPVAGISSKAGALTALAVVAGEPTILINFTEA